MRFVAICFLLLCVSCKAQVGHELPRYRIYVDGKYGYVDQSGKVVIHPQYDHAAKSFAEGLACVKSGGVYGYIDQQGREMLRTPYTYAGNFEEGLAVVRKDGKTGFINTEGRLVIQLQFDGALGFSEERSLVRMGPNYGFIDRKGRVVIPIKYDWAWSFMDGLARYRKGVEEGVLTASGEERPLPHDVYALSQFSDGRLAFRKDRKWGFFDTNLEEAIPPSYDHASRFTNGLASVQVGQEWKLLNIKGKVVQELPSSITWCGLMVERLIAVRERGKFGYMNASGKMQISPKYDDWGDFKDGLALVQLGNHLLYINKTGDAVWTGDLPPKVEGGNTSQLSPP